MDTTETPEVRRFVQEIFRRVAVVSAGWGLSPDRIAQIPRVGLGNDAVARRETVKARIEASTALGTWICPKTAIPTRSSRYPAAAQAVPRGRALVNTRSRERSMSSKGLPLHPREYSAPGLCQQIDSETGRPCGAVLRPRSRHLDEFAASIGFLEQTGDNYIRGKFGLAAEFVHEMASSVRPGHLFNPARAFSGLIFYAFIERHGDLLLPALGASLWHADDPGSAFRSLVRANLDKKARRLGASSLPRNAAFHRAAAEIERHRQEWGTETPDTRKSRTKPREPLDDKTLSGYFSRTVSNLEDLGFLEREIRGKRAELKPLGERLVAAFERQGLLRSEDRTEIPPSFETAHDAFAVTWERYSEIFAPPVSQGTIEQIVRESLLPGAAAPYWKVSAADLDELKCVYHEAVPILAERLTGAARLDAVRLALFLYGLGTGHPVTLEDQALRTPEGDPNGNAAVEIALANPAQYLLGHARMGRRFWSVARARR